MASNLPPGVTEGMIPGNRPEDTAEEAWWVEYDERCHKHFGGKLPAGMPSTDAFPQWLEDLVRIARDMGHEAGYADGARDRDALHAHWQEQQRDH